MKLIVKTNCGEEIVAVKNTAGKVDCFFVYRPERLNLNDTLSGIIRKYDKTLNGYFVETEKKWSVFIPSKEKHNEGDRVFIKITKEARQGKDANGIFIEDTNTTPPTLSQTISQQFNISDIKEWDNETEEALEETLSSSITFNHGAQIHIERTKTCWTIDVDSGNCTEKPHILNYVAAKIIASEIIKRHLGGLILIDFIGTKQTQERIALEKYLIDLLKEDKLSKIMGWTKGRLFEIKRTRTFAPLNDVFLTADGQLNTLSTIYKICDIIKKSPSLKTVVAHPQVIELLREKLKNYAILKADIHYTTNQFEIKD
ncbi:MAG: ribonuclease E/G [Alphaproteobacteria bacterium]|nr:ribonuclease E/G [Alphaproteobacteria bacterium]